MIGILPLFVVLLIIVSFAMVVAVPVILATPGEWEKSQASYGVVQDYGQHWLLSLVSLTLLRYKYKNISTMIIVQL